MDVDVLVVGSVNRDVVTRVDRLPLPGESVLAAELGTFGGGKGANQAVAAARSGARVAMLGATGDDEAGRELRAELEAAGVDVRELKTVVGIPSGTAIITVDRAGENTVAVTEGANGYVSLDPQRRDLRASVVLAQGEIPVGVIKAASQFAAECGARFIFNAAPAPTSVREVPAGADPLVVNDTEAHALAGAHAPSDAVEIGLDLLQRCRAKSVIVTLGSSGSCLVTADEQFHVPAVPSALVVDTTGAGDTYVGTLAARLALGDGLLAAAGAAATAAAESVSWRGARPPRSITVH